MQDKKVMKVEKSTFKYDTVGRERLHNWLISTLTRMSDLSDQLDVPYQVVFNWVKGHRRPSLDMAVKLESITAHHVHPRDWTLFNKTKEPAKSSKVKT